MSSTATTTNIDPRPLHEIATEIKRSWRENGQLAKRPAFITYAMPYVDAMLAMNSASDMYGADRGTDVIAYALSNLTPWRGDDAKRIKAELKTAMDRATKMRSNANRR